MEKERGRMSKEILNLTLEIVYLLTGEDFVVVKKSGELVACRISPSELEASGEEQDPITSSPSNTQTSEKNHEGKILNLSNKVIHLLTGEIWKFIESEDPQTKSERCMDELQDESSGVNTPARFSSPEYSPEEDEGTTENINQSEDYKDVKLVLMPQTEGEDAYVKIKEEHLALNISSDGEEKEHKFSDAPSGPSSPVATDEDTYLCSLCGKCFKCKGRSSHQKDNVGENMYLCSDCETTFHLNPQVVVPPGEDTSSYCVTCRKSFTSKAVFLAHQRIHTGKKSFQCSECGLSFSNQSILETHQSIHTGDKPFSCSDCGKCFAMKANLVKHVKTHNAEKPFTCLDCGKCFGIKSNLVKHQRIHTGEKPFTCEHCEKSFGMKSNLIKHQRIHTGEKPFPCQECGKCFASRSNLVNHERIHTGERPFNCPYCGKGFITSSDLFRHKKTHTENKHLICSTCGESFLSKSGLVAHQKMHTGDKPL